MQQRWLNRQASVLEQQQYGSGTARDGRAEQQQMPSDYGLVALVGHHFSWYPWFKLKTGSAFFFSERKMLARIYLLWKDGLQHFEIKKVSYPTQIRDYKSNQAAGGNYPASYSWAC